MAGRGVSMAAHCLRVDSVHSPLLVRPTNACLFVKHNANCAVTCLCRFLLATDVRPYRHFLNLIIFHLSHAKECCIANSQNGFLLLV